jgi:peptide/nickel transport system permease protein
MVSQQTKSGKPEGQREVEMSLRKYLTKRIVVALFILWAIASLNFFLFEIISPVKPHQQYHGLSPKFTEEMRQALLELWGLKKPMYIRYLKYVRNMFTWNFGFSLHTMTPIAVEMSWRLSITVMLLGSAFVATILIGITVGIFAASRRGSKVDVLATGGGIFAWGIPIFYVQLLSLLLFSYYAYVAFGFRVFPLGGVATSEPMQPLEYMADIAWHLAMPLMTLVVGGFGTWALVTRNVMLEALTQDYVVTARAKGLSERTVLYRHAFRGTLPPIVTMITMSIPGIITGSVITESIFSLPGIGFWYLRGLMSADYPVIESLLFMFSVLTVFANFAADLLYGIVDPRIRVGESYRK